MAHKRVAQNVKKLSLLRNLKTIKFLRGLERLVGRAGLLRALKEQQKKVGGQSFLPAKNLQSKTQNLQALPQYPNVRSVA